MHPEDRPFAAASQKILQGAATLPDIKLWLSWEFRASLGPIAENIITKLIEWLEMNRDIHEQWTHEAYKDTAALQEKLNQAQADHLKLARLIAQLNDEFTDTPPAECWGELSDATFLQQFDPEEALQEAIFYAERLKIT